MGAEQASWTGYRFLTCQIKPIRDTDVVDGKVVTRNRVAASFSDTGREIVAIVADSVAEVLHKVAMYAEANGITL